jgi:hypothetical protein
MIVDTEVITVDEIPETASGGTKSRRGVKRHEENPFMALAAINTKIGSKRITNKTGEQMMIVSQETGEIIAPAGFHTVIEVDKNQFVKLYINGVKAFRGLKAAGTTVFEVIYMAIQKQIGQDDLYIHYNSIDHSITPMSEATFYRGMKELIEKGFIAESTRPNIYFLNVDYLFNGNRLAFIKEYRLKDPSAKPTSETDKLKLEAAGQQRLIQ